MDTKSTEDEINNFEAEVRRLIVKFLQFEKQGIPLDSEEKIDGFLFFSQAKEKEQTS